MAKSIIDESDILLIEEKEEQLENAFEIGGVEEVKKLLLSKRDEWKFVNVNVAVTGESGVGKSTLINALRGLTADDEGAAHTDVKEATRKATGYKHPKNGNILFWDLPGVGTLNFPQKTYLRDVNLKRFDVFIILSVGRCREVDLWLCNEVKHLGKMFYFVRTKMQVEVEGDQKSHPKTHTKETVVKRIRHDCEDNLKKAQLPVDRIFLIDSFHIKDADFDFDKFSIHIIDELPSKKREALTLSLTTLTKGIIQRKKAILLSRINKVALLSAICGAIPIPGINAMFDAALTKLEIIEYRNQFGLPAKPSADSHISVNSWNLLNSLGDDKDVPNIAHFIAGYIEESESMRNVKLNVGLRILGSVAGAVISYRTTSLALRKILDELTEEVHTMISINVGNDFAPSM